MREFDDDLRAARAFDLLSLIGGGALKRQGAYLIGPCPLCGGSDRFNVKLNGGGTGIHLWHCRYCSDGGYGDAISYVMREEGLAFAEAVRHLAGRPASPVRHTPPPAHEPAHEPTTRAAWWVDRAEELAAQFARHPRAAQYWQNHKPLALETIAREGLGVGVLPSNSLCRHERLIVPVREAGRVIAFVGRQLSCDCRARSGQPLKWLPAGGGPSRWLAGVDEIQHGDIVFLVENKVDRLLLRQAGLAAIAPSAMTQSASWWQEQAARLVARRAAAVVIALDHDLAGNGGGADRAAMVAAWREELRARGHQQWRTLREPLCQARRVAEALARRVPCHIYQYPKGTRWKSSLADLHVVAAVA